MSIAVMVWLATVFALHGATPLSAQTRRSAWASPAASARTSPAATFGQARRAHRSDAGAFLGPGRAENFVVCGECARLLSMLTPMLRIVKNQSPHFRSGSYRRLQKNPGGEKVLRWALGTPQEKFTSCDADHIGRGQTDDRLSLWIDRWRRSCHGASASSS